MKIIKTTFKIIEYVLLVAMIALLIFSGVVVIKKQVLKEEVPKVFGYSNSIVVSGSMETVLSVDDWIIVKEQDGYDVNDIITFNTQSGLVTHRIIEITEEGYVTKGDANNREDIDIVTEEKVAGKLVATIPNVGKVIEWIKSPYGIVTLILLIAVLLIVPYIVRRYKEEK